MENQIDIKTLYSLQDTILDHVMSLENDFYLTGGTALHRFYLNKRYSMDLDFFVSDARQFYEDVQELIETLKESKLSLAQEVGFRDFYRFRVNTILQVDFVNDRVYRYGKSKLISKYRIDNLINIFTNKITALVSRDEEKDFFDFICCVRSMQFNWAEILQIANKKARVEKETLLYRIKTFPLAFLENLYTIDPMTVSVEEMNILTEDIIHERDNRLNKNIA